MPRIICIDPDAGRAQEPVEVLRSAGYEVMLAFSPEVGMALLRLFPPDIVLLDSQLADQFMPQIHQACPSAPVVLTGAKPVSVEDLQWLTSHQRVGVEAQDARRLPH
jgi:DNA-binding response OmpR family regulator